MDRMASLAQTIAELQVQANALVVKLNMLATLVPPVVPIAQPVPAVVAPVAEGGRRRPRKKT